MEPTSIPLELNSGPPTELIAYKNFYTYTILNWITNVVIISKSNYSGTPEIRTN